MTSPLIAVALPVYNGADYLRTALDSILAQGFTDFELVVSDNASTDETPAILAEYAARDGRVRVSRSDVFLPQADNVNRAVELCASEWVKLFCHDDLMEPDCLGAIASAIETMATDRLGLIGNGESWLFMNGYRHREGDEQVGERRPRYWVGPALLGRSLAGAPAAPVPSLTTATVRRSAWEASTRFDGRFAHFDTFLWTRLLMTWDYVYIPRALTVNRIHGRQVAVSARTSLRTVHDHRRFWPEYLAEYGSSLGLGRSARLRVRLKPLGAAATVVAVELLKRRWRSALALALRTPWRWWPALPLLVARSYRNEGARTRRLAEHVPYPLLYP